MQTINTTRLESQIHAIEKKIVKGKVKNYIAAKRKVYNLRNQLTELKQFNFLAR